VEQGSGSRTLGAFNISIVCGSGELLSSILAIGSA
jgi:hypothetical protein